MHVRLFLTLLLFCLPSLSSAQPLVATTIRPLQMIAAAITDSVSEPVPVMRANASPHHYSMRPSERQALANADVLLWVGPILEGFLDGLAQELDTELVTVETLPGLHELLMGESLDPHVWLDLLNGELIADVLAARLSELDPANADVYQQNLLRFQDGLTRTRLALRERLNRLQERQPYAVYHNAFQYFEAQFGLGHILSFTENEELNPGVKRLLQIKEVMDANAVDCILVEPATNIQELDAVMSNIGVAYVTVDVLGSDIPVSPEAYFSLMESVGNGVFTCLE